MMLLSMRLRIVVFALTAGLPPWLMAQQPPTQALDPAFKEQFEQGQQALKAHKYKEAIDSFKKANKIQHNACGECYFFVALAYYDAQDLDHVLENCNKAIETLGTNSGRALAHNLKGNALAATAGSERKKLLLAESEFRSALQLEPKAAVFHINLARVLLRQSKDDEGKQELETCLSMGPEERLAGEARRLLADPRRAREEIAPDFELTTLQGQQMSLSQLAGRVVVMDFWATWCPPCRASVPELRELTKKYPTDKLVLISVSADKDEKEWREFVAKKNMDWAQYRDTDHKVLDAFAIHAFPTYLVIDGDGVVKERITGLNPQESVVHRLKATLQQMPQLEGEAHK
jgi:thiol-disulfide isomerase/thioredoxin/Tfp pilus assembly protein PilF